MKQKTIIHTVTQVITVEVADDLPDADLLDKVKAATNELYTDMDMLVEQDIINDQYRVSSEAAL